MLTHYFAAPGRATLARFAWRDCRSIPATNFPQQNADEVQFNSKAAMKSGFALELWRKKWALARYFAAVLELTEIRWHVIEPLVFLPSTVSNNQPKRTK